MRSTAFNHRPHLRSFYFLLLLLVTNMQALGEKQHNKGSGDRESWAIGHFGWPLHLPLKKELDVPPGDCWSRLYR
jgi:hypothetical protein